MKLKAFLLFAVASLQNLTAYALPQASPFWLQCKSADGSYSTVRNYFYVSADSLNAAGQNPLALNIVQIVEPLSLSVPIMANGVVVANDANWMVTVSTIENGMESSWTYQIRRDIGLEPAVVNVQYTMVKTETSSVVEESNFQVSCTTSELLP